MNRIKQDFLRELFKHDLAYTEDCSEEENKKFNSISDCVFPSSIGTSDLPDEIEKIDSNDVPPKYFKYIKEKLQMKK